MRRSPPADDDSLKAGEAIYGLGAIKGLGEGPIAQLVEAREADGPFTDLFDFCRRIGTGKVNRRAIESLIRAGAFDSLNEQRWVLMSSLEDAVGQADQEARNEAVGMDDMFGLGGGAGLHTPQSHQDSTTSPSFAGRSPHNRNINKVATPRGMSPINA